MIITATAPSKQRGAKHSGGEWNATVRRPAPRKSPSSPDPARVELLNFEFPGQYTGRALPSAIDDAVVTGPPLLPIKSILAGKCRKCTPDMRNQNTPATALGISDHV
jgi:hypothetical protein